MGPLEAANLNYLTHKPNFLWSSGQISRRYQILRSRGLERGPLSVVSTFEELLERKSSDPGLENRDYGRKGSAALTTRHSFIRKSRK
jgi:hypothetical protein